MADSLALPRKGRILGINNSGKSAFDASRSFFGVEKAWLLNSARHPIRLSDCPRLSDGTPYDGGKNSAVKIERQVKKSAKGQRVEEETGFRGADAGQGVRFGEWEWNIVNNKLWLSDEICRIFGLRSRELVTTYERFLKAVHPDDRESVEASVNRALYERQPFGVEHRIVLRNGTRHIVHHQGKVHFDDDGTPLRMSGTTFDITECMGAWDNLHMLTQAVEQNPAMVIITDVGGNIEYVNPKFTEVTEYSPDEAIGRNLRILETDNNPPEVYKDFWETITSGREWRGDLHNRKKNGDPYWEHVSISPIRTSDGSITHFLAVKEDITVRKEHEERLLRQANFDDLTGLPNRVLALDRLHQALAFAHRENRNVAVMIVGLDNFKKANETLGHAVGDQLLANAATRLTACIRESDSTARIGGDEFLIILPDIGSVVDSEVVAENILEVISRPFAFDDHEIFATASIGLSVYPNDGDNPHVLLQNANAAMRRAKETGRNCHRFFIPEMNDRAVERLRLEAHLRHALEREEMRLHYQPIVDLCSGGLVGAEALLRWQSSEFGLMPPDRFVPLAEETGLIFPIGEWVLRTACREAKTWQARGAPPFPIWSSPITSRETM